MAFKQKSQKTLPIVIVLFKVFKILFVNLNTASSVANPFLKPNWFSANRLLLWKCSVSLIYRAFSRTPEKEVNNDIGL
jgi:hypothetical protein